MKIEDKIVKHLRTFRALNGKNQKEMAEIIGVSYRTYQEIEALGVIKKLEVLNKLKETTGFDPQESRYQQRNRYFSVGNSDAGKEISKLIDLTLNQQAQINILLKTLEVISADVSKRAVSLVSGEMQQAIKIEYDRLHEEYAKKL